MPASRNQQNGRALQTLDPNVRSFPPITPSKLTPGKHVRHLKDEIEKKDKKNEELLNSICDLTKALNEVTLVKKKIQDAPVVNETAKKTDMDVPAPPKTAYKIYCSAYPGADGSDMRKMWKECPANIRKDFTVMADADKVRYQQEMAKYEEEKLALEMYYEKKKEDMAMEFYEAHLAALAAAENAAANDPTKKGKKKTPKDPDAPKRPTSAYMYFAAENRAAIKKKSPEASVVEIAKVLGENWNKLQKGKKGKKGTKKYDDMAAADKIRYVAEKEEYNKILAQRKLESEKESIDRYNRDKEEALKLMNVFKGVSDTITNEARNEINHFEDMSVISDISSTAVGSSNIDTKKQKKKKDPNAPKKARNAYIYFVTENRSKIQASMPHDSTQTEILTEVGRQWKELSDIDKTTYVLMAEKDKERYMAEMETYNAGK